MAENMLKSDLKIDWATYSSAKYAVEHWHYSGCLPAGKLVKVGAWEKNKFIGVVLFGRGANNRMSSAYDLKQDEACELVRIALKDHITPVSRISAQAIKFLKRQSAGLKLIVSYADPKQGHHGGIYQAGNWVYYGKSQAQRELIIDGVFTHKRSAHAKYGTASPQKIKDISGSDVDWSPIEWKHIYLMPLNKEMKDRIEPLAKPYPKREKQAMASFPEAQRQGSTDLHAPILKQSNV
tara:strand:+ start:356 stop:1066 length:711 start_codon:yes stop_codon:yes gene_type:complete